MAKKPKDAPAQKPPIPGPAPSAEEMRRLHIETNAKDGLRAAAEQVLEMVKGDIKKTDRLQAIIALGESIMSQAMHTRGRLRANAGRGDAFLESTAANVQSGLRKALKTMEMHDRELSVWDDSMETLKPVLDDIKRIAAGLDRPGVKTAVAPGGEPLFDEDNQPAFDAWKNVQNETPTAAPAPEPPPGPAAPEPEAPAAAPAPAQANVAGREIPTLGMGPVIDVEPEPPADHPLEGKTEEEA